MARVRGGWPALLVAAVLLAGCSGGGPEVAGTYEHPEEGVLTVDADGTAALDQSGQVSELAWTVDGDAITFTFEGEEFGGTLEDDAIVFEVGAFSGDEPARFERTDGG